MTVRNILTHPELQSDDDEFDAWCDKVITTCEKVKEDFFNG